IEQMETVRRGYSISRQETFLLPFNQAQRNATEDYQALLVLTADNHSQQQRLVLLKPLMEELMALGRRDFNTRGIDASQAAATLTHTRLLVEQSRELIEALSVEER